MVHKSEASLSYMVNPCLTNTKGKRERKRKRIKTLLFAQHVPE